MDYLVWSNEHQMWWRDSRSGYTPYIEEAGRYTEDEAHRIVDDATVAHTLYTRNFNAATTKTCRMYSEWAVPAPEGLP